MEKFSIAPPSAGAMSDSERRWDSIAKPLKSLGKLETAVIKLAGIQGTDRVDIGKKCSVVMCADNGVVAEGVTQTGQEVTLVVAKNMALGKGSINIFSRECGADVLVVDIGMVSEGGHEGILDKKIMPGTKNMFLEPAMGRKNTIKAIETGIDMVGELKAKGYKIIATGEMGIGNTTSSSAIAACLLGKTPAEVTGRGAGLTNNGLCRKIEVIEGAIKKHSPDVNDPLDILSKVGGLDIAGMTGLFLGAAIHRVPVIIDGLISSVAALLAVRLSPKVLDYIFASHISKEPAGRAIISELGLSCFFDLDMCLGEGTGAVLAFKMFDMALAIYNNMSSFEDIKIESYQPLGG